MTTVIKTIPQTGESAWARGTLPVGGVQLLNAQGSPIPCTITLASVLAGRKIEFSTDDGVNWFEPTKDVDAVAFIVTSLGSPVSSVRLTGNAGDIWSLR